MSKNRTSLIDVAKKPGSYITDIETLKEAVREKTPKKHTSIETKAATIAVENPDKDRATPRKEALVTQNIVGLHVPIPQELRKKLKIKAIAEGKKMKDLILDLIKKHLEKI